MNIGECKVRQAGINMAIVSDRSRTTAPMKDEKKDDPEKENIWYKFSVASIDVRLLFAVVGT